MTKSPRKNVPDVGIELGAAFMPSELASDRATAPGPKQIARWGSKQAESQDDSYFPSKWPDETVSKWKAKMTALSQQMARWDS